MYCCGICTTGREPWVLPNPAEDLKPSKKKPKVCVGLLRGDNLTLLLTWGSEGEYPERELSGHCSGPWLPHYWNGQKNGFLPSFYKCVWDGLTNLLLPTKACPLLPGAPAKWTRIPKPQFPFLQKQRFCLMCFPKHSALNEGS